ncbi:glycosyltransferase family 4 protein [Pseudomonadales bacterium]|nr:glycosyltransferase family 4 protein [Pseudomonadales bacterium]
MLKHIPKVVHLTSVHPRFDTRIFLKMCRSLSGESYCVSLIVADNLGDEINEGINIYDVGASKNRLTRMLSAPKRVLQKAVELDGDLYHLHDPELIPIGLKLKRQGKKVIFDSHEDVPKQLIGRHYLNSFMRRILSIAFAHYERYACSKLDGILTSTRYIRDKFVAINPRTLDINNFPILGELAAVSSDESKRDSVCYLGGMGALRGTKQLVEAMEYVHPDTRLDLVGTFSEKAFEEEVRETDGWKKVYEHGFLDRNEVRVVLSRSLVGVVNFLEAPNHVDSQPNKLFEYMSAGVPIISSNFPLWKEVVEGNDCGLCVDPSKPADIANAINSLVQNPQRAREMGLNGKKAVEEYYNWAEEEKKLFAFYGSLLESSK